MRSPRAISSPCCANGTMRRAITPAIKRTPTFDRAFARLETEPARSHYGWPIRLERVEKLAGGVFEIGDLSADGRVLDVHIEDGKEDGNALAFAAHEGRLGGGADGIHLAVSRREHQVGARRHARIRVTKEVEREEREDRPNRREEAEKGQAEAALGTANAPTARITSSTISAIRINLKAAFLALPECFIRSKGRVKRGPGKD